jgi:AraC family transcriptional regulator
MSQIPLPDDGRKPLVRALHFANALPVDLPEVKLDRHLIFLHKTAAPVRMIERNDGEPFEGVARPGLLNVLTAGLTSYCRWDAPLSGVRLDIAPEFVQRVAAQTEGIDSSQIAFSNQYRIHDAMLAQFAEWLATETATGANGRLYAESLANMLVVHMLRNHGATAHVIREPSGGLGRERLARATEFIRANLEGDLSLDDIAGAVHLTPYHFARLFKQSTGTSPHQFVIQQRIELAKQLLKDKQRTIADVAVAVGFADHAHLSRHFKAQTGLTPSAFQAQ